jgi:hypothetical protein
MEFLARVETRIADRGVDIQHLAKLERSAPLMAIEEIGLTFREQYPKFGRTYDLAQSAPNGPAKLAR